MTGLFAQWWCPKRKGNYMQKWGCFEIYERHVTTASASPSSLTAAVLFRLSPRCATKTARRRESSHRNLLLLFSSFSSVLPCCKTIFFFFSYGADNPLARHPTAAFTTGPTHQYHLLIPPLSVGSSNMILFFKKENKHWENNFFFFF